MIISHAVTRRLARVLWIQISMAKNPWFASAASTGDEKIHARWDRRNQQQLQLTRELFQVVFHNVDPTEDLMERVLNFLDE